MRISISCAIKSGSPCVANPAQGAYEGHVRGATHVVAKRPPIGLAACRLALSPYRDRPARVATRVDFDLVDRAFLPSFGETLSALWEMSRNGEIGFNLLVSIYRAFAGLAMGSIIGVAIGLAMATSRRADEFFGPLVATTYSLPKSSLVPLFILWFGIGDVTSIVSVLLACL